MYLTSGNCPSINNKRTPNPRPSFSSTYLPSQLVSEQLHSKDTVRFGGPNEDLYQALKHREKSSAKQLVEESKADINMFTPSGETFCTLAVQRKDKDGLEFLHGLNADINKADRDGWTPLGLAVANGQKDIVRCLHGLNADMGKACPGHNALGLAIALEKNGMVDLLHNELNVDLTATNEQGQTPLTVAAALGKTKAIDVLLKNKTSSERIELLNAQDEQGWTPLTIAAASNQLPSIALLYKYRADLTIPNKGKRIPLECAQREGHTQAAELIDTLMKAEDANQKNEPTEHVIRNKQAVHLDRQADIPEDVSVVSFMPSDLDPGPDNASEILSREEFAPNRHKELGTGKHKQGSNNFTMPLSPVTERKDEQAWMLDDASSVGFLPSDYDPASDLISTEPKQSTGLRENTAHNQKGKHRTNQGFLPLILEYPQEQQGSGQHNRNPWQRGAFLRVPTESHRIIQKTSPSIISDSSTVSSITGYRSGSSPLLENLPYLFVDQQKRIEEYFTQESDHGAHPLIDAAVAGNLGQAISLLKARPSIINDTTTAGSTALQWAASLGRTSIVEYLLNNAPEVDVNKPNEDGHTPLIMAAAYNHPDTVAALVKSPKININLKDLRGDINNPDAMYNQGHNPLLVACKSGHTKVVEELMKSPALDVNVQTLGGNESPLTSAVKGNHYDVAKALLSKYKGLIDINHRNQSGNTPLMIAAAHGYKRLSKLMLAQDGIDINPSFGSANEDTPLIRAAQNGDKALPVLERLLKFPSIQLNAQGEGGKTALANAAEKGHENTVQRLLAEQKLDPAIMTMNGDNALTLAALNGNVGIVRPLLATNRFDINHRNNDGNTALHLAARNNDLPLIELLLAQKGINVGLTNKRKGAQGSKTAAEIAESRGWTETASRLKQSQKSFHPFIKD